MKEHLVDLHFCSLQVELLFTLLTVRRKLQPLESCFEMVFEGSDRRQPSTHCYNYQLLHHSTALPVLRFVDPFR